MVKKISIRDIKVNWLNVRCLTLISKYVQLAHKLDETVINLRDRDVLPQVMDHARSNDNAELHKIYSKIRLELRVILSDEAMASRIAADTAPDSLGNRPVHRAARFLRS
jgi:hypothetical protein